MSLCAGVGGRGSGAVGVSPHMLGLGTALYHDNRTVVFVVNSLRQAEPFRGIATAPERARLANHTIFETDF